ncbi:MAG: hypothetical protein A3J24_11390 [Deltaproteobacteria bacterium RIFCSPLOWO2_02_FULL_53_8]|nr:MAG: hypothetical protein A3J24_11390 [Deltaproteobacteria bacterium RIFCSPLOWO2_02_FULL_53_8]
MLLDLRQRGEFTDDMFATTQPAAAEQVMAVLDQINRKWGRGTLRRCAGSAGMGDVQGYDEPWVHHSF